MDSQIMHSFSSLYLKSYKHTKVNPSWMRSYHTNKRLCFKYTICGYLPSACKWGQEQKTLHSQRLFVTMAKKGDHDPTEVKGKDRVVETEKKGSVAGAAALIIGTSIGTGMLALPQKVSSAGFVPSSICLILCWGFLLIEALLLVEINVGLRRKKWKREDDNELEVISIRSMAQETLGDWGGTLATLTYVFLGYTSMIAYSSKSGEILFHLVHLPESVACCLFTAIFALLISVGGTRATDQVNQWLTVSMIGLLVVIEVLIIVFGGWSGLEGGGDWGKVPDTIPVMVFALVYHDLVPVLCAYLGGDLARLRASLILGSIVPLLGLLVWDGIALGFSAQADQNADPVQLMMSVQWSGVSHMVEAFSLLAEPKELFGLEKWWRRNTINFLAMALAIAPTLIVSTTVPDAFSAATDIAGGYCMTILYGVLPPAMAWATRSKEQGDYDQKVMISRTRPELLGVGICACGIVVEQIYQDFLTLHP
ncbi:hypothetical protein Tsubulata_019717 [Turnera subulata]|uniref:Amino acid transporter transmembrane domain-containing protein n=1 Tax=Turnera subulata TaxID=218843 RepID=A0A9Q0JLY4_9ROSI|nr:hypothetical protein Tsubulata_019717 [Turnera subulata]